jgi:hypothetical protein
MPVIDDTTTTEVDAHLTDHGDLHVESITLRGVDITSAALIATYLDDEDFHRRVHEAEADDAEFVRDEMANAWRDAGGWR